MTINYCRSQISQEMSKIQNHPNLRLHEFEFPTFHSPWYPFPWNEDITLLISNTPEKKRKNYNIGCSVYISHELTTRIHYKDKVDRGWPLLMSRSGSHCPIRPGQARALAQPVRAALQGPPGPPVSRWIRQAMPWSGKVKMTCQNMQNMGWLGAKNVAWFLMLRIFSGCRSENLNQREQNGPVIPRSYNSSFMANQCKDLPMGWMASKTTINQQRLETHGDQLTTVPHSTGALYSRKCLTAASKHGTD